MSRRKQWAAVRQCAATAGLVVAVILLAAILIMAGGCDRAIIQGGSSQRVIGELLITATPDGAVTLQDSREQIATTQPSVDAVGMMPKIEGAGEGDGEIGGVSVSQLKTRGARNWKMGGLLALCAAGAWVLGRRLAAVLLLVAAIVAVLYPIAFWLLLAGGVAYIAYAGRAGIKQVAAGVQKVIEKTHPDDVPGIKLALEAKQDGPTKRVVRSVLGK